MPLFPTLLLILPILYYFAPPHVNRKNEIFASPLHFFLKFDKICAPGRHKNVMNSVENVDKF